jgi:hypothetical protein
MKTAGLTLTVFAALAFASAAPAEAKEGGLKAFASPVVKKVARGATRVGMFGSGLAMLVAAKGAYAMGNHEAAGVLGLGGLNLVVTSFKREPTEGLVTNLALTATAATGGYLLGGSDGHFPMMLLGALPAAGGTIGNLVATAVSHD